MTKRLHSCRKSARKDHDMTHVTQTHSIVLPDKPSELIGIAMQVLERVENDSRYAVDMATWHEPNQRTGICSVCLAGAVMTRVLDPRSEEFMLHRHDIFDDRTRMKLVALDYFRCGYVDAALSLLDIDCNIMSLRRRRQITPYETNPHHFREDMNDLVKLLRNHDL
jgi:hypothetical protein